MNKFNELERGKPGLFELFINYLLNDFIETFDEAFNKLKEVKHFEILMASSQLREQETALAIKDKIKANNINKNTISYYLLVCIFYYICRLSVFKTTSDFYFVYIQLSYPLSNINCIYINIFSLTSLSYDK